MSVCTSSFCARSCHPSTGSIRYGLWSLKNTGSRGTSIGASLWYTLLAGSLLLAHLCPRVERRPFRPFEHRRPLKRGLQVSSHTASAACAQPPNNLWQESGSALSAALRVSTVVSPQAGPLLNVPTRPPWSHPQSIGAPAPRSGALVKPAPRVGI